MTNVVHLVAVFLLTSACKASNDSKSAPTPSANIAIKCDGGKTSIWAGQQGHINAQYINRPCQETLPHLVLQCVPMDSDFILEVSLDTDERKNTNKGTALIYKELARCEADKKSLLEQAKKSRSSTAGSPTQGASSNKDTSSSVTSPGQKYAQKGEKLYGVCIYKAENKLVSCIEYFTSKADYEKQCLERNTTFPASDAENISGRNVEVTVQRSNVCPIQDIVNGCAGKDPDGLEEVIWRYGPSKDYFKSTFKCLDDQERLAVP